MVAGLDGESSFFGFASFWQLNTPDRQLTTLTERTKTVRKIYEQTEKSIDTVTKAVKGECIQQPDRCHHCKKFSDIGYADRIFVDEIPAL